MRRPHPLAIVLLFLLQGPALATAAEAPTASFDRGKQYFDQGRFDTAYQEFYEVFKRDPVNLDLNFYLGQAAFESGRFEEAVMAYDRILIANPEATRVKLELGRTHLRLGNRELARQYFSEVLAANPPEAVRQHIQKFMAAIDAAEQRHFLNGMFALGMSHDDNVNVAPSANSVNVDLGAIIPITINQAPIRDQIYSTTLMANHTFKPEDSPLSWKTTAVSYNAFYGSQNIHDLNFISLASGPAYQKQNLLWEAHAQLNSVDLEYDRYLGAYGFGSTLTAIVTPTIFFNLGLTVQQKNYYQDGGKDADNYLLTAGPVFTGGPNRVSLTLAKEYENAALDLGNSYDRLSIFARYDRQLPLDFSLFTSLHFQSTQYDETDPLYINNRKDLVRDFALGFSKLAWQSQDRKQSLSGQLSYTKTLADSNIAIYEYRKDVTAAEMSLSF